uniref:Fibrinogen C-terminal domain-containing protein n=1 Tax=Anopheles atroparvus TaxID=41427 RepID=A0A182J0X9_ANOAO
MSRGEEGSALGSTMAVDNFNLGGGWTVFQRRIDGAVNFYRNWTMYKNGFGDVNGEHWLGLEKLHLMMKSGRHELLVILEDHEGRSAYAHYESFQIGSEAEKYKLTVGGYSGTAGDALSVHDEEKFTTFDQDNDAEDDYDGADEEDDYNCAKKYNGAWWFNACYDSECLVLSSRHQGREAFQSRHQRGLHRERCEKLSPSLSLPRHGVEAQYTQVDSFSSRNASGIRAFRMMLWGVTVRVSLVESESRLWNTPK